jgi:hypothetical protein
MEAMQCMVERRRGGERGVTAVTYLDGPAVFEARDRGLWSAELMEAAGGFVNRPARKRYQDYEGVSLLLVEYSGGFRLAMLCIPGIIMPDGGEGQEGDDGAGGHCAYAARYRTASGGEGTHGCEFYLQPSGVHAHFSYLCLNIQRLFHNPAEPPWPAERTLLTTGIVDVVLESRL